MEEHDRGIGSPAPTVAIRSPSPARAAAALRRCLSLPLSRGMARAGERGDFLVVDRAEFRQLGQQHRGGGAADPRHALEDVATAATARSART